MAKKHQHKRRCQAPNRYACSHEKSTGECMALFSCPSKETKRKTKK